MQSVPVTTQDFVFAAIHNYKGPKMIMLLNLELSFKSLKLYLLLIIGNIWARFVLFIGKQRAQLKPVEYQCEYWNKTSNETKWDAH